METAGDAAAGIPGPGEQTCQAVANLASLTYLEGKILSEKVTMQIIVTDFINDYFYNLGQ